MSERLITITVGVLVTTVLTLTVGIGGLLGGGTGAPCPPSAVTASAVAASPGAGTTGIGTGTGTAGAAIDAEQLANATTIVAAAQQRQLPPRAGVIAIATALQESGLHNLDHGDRDSRGVFQQRPSQGWGTTPAGPGDHRTPTQRLTDPAYAATAFYTRLEAISGWQDLDLGVAAQAVQRSAHPGAYARWELPATRLVSAVLSGAADDTALLPAGPEPVCAPGPAGTFTGPGGPFPAEDCTVRPDPTTGRGCLTARTLALATQLRHQGWRVSCWDAHVWNPASDHRTGRACDVFPGHGGVLPSADAKAGGDALAAALQASAGRTGVAYLIWYGRIWSVARSSEGWRPYDGGGVYDQKSITGGHFDHVHISLY